MGFRTFRDRMATGMMGVIGGLLAYIIVAIPDLRTEALTLLGPWGTLILQFYFRKREETETPPHL